MNSSDLVIDVTNLTKRYGDLLAVDSINLKIPQGELFGLIGPDGAGKTSIFHMLGGILDPTSGSISVLGIPAWKARLEIGYLTQQFSLYSDLTVEQNLQYASGLRSVPLEKFTERKEYYLKLMDLKQFCNRLAGNLSGGMKQKLALCCALISRPRLLLLDEPTTGVDPVSRRDFWDVLTAIAAEGVTIAVATPYLDEAERCSSIALIHKGVICETGTPSQLKKKLGLDRLELRGAPLASIESLIKTTPALNQLVLDTQEFGDRLDILLKDAKAAEPQIKKAAATQGMVLDCSEQEPTLENVFALTIRKNESIKTQELFPFLDMLPEQGTAMQAINLTKNFGTFKAVDAVTISVSYGEIYGLLGANGAGKTTTIKMLCGLLEATSGKMVLANRSHNLQDPALRRKLGYMSQKFTLYDDLTVLENLRFYGGIYKVSLDLMERRIRWVLDTCNLSDSENMVTGQLPGGFRQRLAFGATVLHQPSILFLDEPTSGVDPLARRELWALISEFARQGTAILITTHFLEEAEYCHQLGFMVDGQLVTSGPPDQIKKSQPGKLLEIKTNSNQQAVELLRKVAPRWQISIFGNTLHVVIENDAQERQFIQQLNEANIITESSRVIPFSLEDSFIGIAERNKKLEAA